MSSDTLTEWKRQSIRMPLSTTTAEESNEFIQDTTSLIVPKQPPGEGLSLEAFVSNEGITASPGSQLTFNYRPRGQDTLTVGDAHCWILNKTRFSFLERFWDSEFFTHRGIDYAVLLENIEGRCDRGILSWSQLSQVYSMRNSSRVYRFLQAHPQLVNMLVEALPYLQSCFSANAKFELRVVQHPESREWEQLLCYIISPLPIGESLELLDRFDDEWFLDQQTQAAGLLNFDVRSA